MAFVKDELLGEMVTDVRQATEEEKLMLIGESEVELTVIEFLSGRIVAGVQDGRAAQLYTLSADGEDAMVFAQ